MKRFTQICLALMATGAIGLAGAPTLLGATGHATNTLVVKIAASPASGIVWGPVKVTYTSGGRKHTVGTCRASSFTFQPPAKVKLNLVETAKDSSSWPFKNWKVKTGTRPRRTPARRSV